MFTSGSGIGTICSPRLASEPLVYDALNYLVISVTMLPQARVVEAREAKPRPVRATEHPIRANSC